MRKVFCTKLAEGSLQELRQRGFPDTTPPEQVREPSHILKLYRRLLHGLLQYHFLESFRSHFHGHFQSYFQRQCQFQRHFQRLLQCE